MSYLAHEGFLLSLFSTLMRNNNRRGLNADDPASRTVVQHDETHVLLGPTTYFLVTGPFASPSSATSTPVPHDPNTVLC